MIMSVDEEKDLGIYLSKDFKLQSSARRYVKKQVMQQVSLLKILNIKQDIIVPMFKALVLPIQSMPYSFRVNTCENTEKLEIVQRVLKVTTL